MQLRNTAIILALGALVLCVPASAVAAQTYNDTIGGYEYFATSTDGRFAGTASGALSGYWNTDVQHTTLCGTCTPTATISGGSFSLATTLDGSYTLITGKFTGGSVNVTNPGANCTKQTFAVDGVIGSVGTWYSGSGLGTFSATLTHYRHWLFGSCITYFASIDGSISLTF
jgi:hypothetical protein